MSSVRTATSFQVTLGGTTYTQADAQGIESLVLEDHVDMMDMLTMKLVGNESAPEWSAEVGQAVEAKMGAGSVLLFKGEVVSIDPQWTNRGGSMLTVRCYDHTHRLARGRKTRFWENATDTDIVKEVGGESGLEVEADPSPVTYPYTLQRNETNLGFLKRIAARNNFLMTVREGKLQFKAATTSTTATKLKMGESLRSLNMNFNSTDQVTEVIVRGWDPGSKREIEGRASEADSPNIGKGKKGSSVASSMFGEKKVYITDVPVTSDPLATELAKSEFKRLARQFGRGSCTVDGNDALRAGAMVEFEGLSKGYNGSFYIVSSRHTVSSGTGYVTEFQFCSDTMGT